MSIILLLLAISINYLIGTICHLTNSLRFYVTSGLSRLAMLRGLLLFFLSRCEVTVREKPTLFHYFVKHHFEFITNPLSTNGDSVSISHIFFNTNVYIHCESRQVSNVIRLYIHWKRSGSVWVQRSTVTFKKRIYITSNLSII